MRLSDLSTEDEDSGHCKMNRYDKKIDSLMNAVGCLKSEVREVGGLGQLASQGWVGLPRWLAGGHSFQLPLCFGRPLGRWSVAGRWGQPGIPPHLALSPGPALTLTRALDGWPGLIFVRGNEAVGIIVPLLEMK